MVKFQRLIHVVLVFHSCLLTISTSITSIEPKNIHAKNNSLELRLVSAVFRHGDRIIDRQNLESYPNDPYKNKNFYPNGDGQLTNIGKKRAYKLGLQLKDKYDSFLGDIYYLPNVYARSTEMTRTKMTLQLVLAALYPPVDTQEWQPGLSWQPIDLIYAPQNKDDLFFAIESPTYRKIYKEQLQSPEVEKKIEEFNDFMEKVSKYTGRNITNLVDCALLYNTLSAESSMNLTLPEWTQDIFPNGKLLDAAILFLELLSYDQLNNLNGGVLLNRIIDDMNKVINGTLMDRKINLFSGHDINVSAMLYALNIPIHRYPAYTSSVIIELYEKDEMYFVKVLYYFGDPALMLEVTIPGCEMLCPYDKFIELVGSTKTLK